MSQPFRQSEAATPPCLYRVTARLYFHQAKLHQPSYTAVGHRIAPAIDLYLQFLVSRFI